MLDGRVIEKDFDAELLCYQLAREFLHIHHEDLEIIITEFKQNTNEAELCQLITQFFAREVQIFQSDKWDKELVRQILLHSDIIRAYVQGCIACNANNILHYVQWTSDWKAERWFWNRYLESDNLCGPGYALTYCYQNKTCAYTTRENKLVHIVDENTLLEAIDTMHIIDYCDIIEEIKQNGFDAFLKKYTESTQILTSTQQQEIARVLTSIAQYNQAEEEKYEKEHGDVGYRDDWNPAKNNFNGAQCFITGAKAKNKAKGHKHFRSDKEPICKWCKGPHHTFECPDAEEIQKEMEQWEENYKDQRFG